MAILLYDYLARTKQNTKVHNNIFSGILIKLWKRMVENIYK